ncbi:MAG: DNA polymerase III subunit alpha, partial [Armatimonadota bacterium]
MIEAKMGDFVHLHAHSCFSLLDGAADVRLLTRRAKELGMPAIAVTDHDGLYGAIRFYKAAQEADIQPIVGAELTLEGGCHVVLLAMDREGYSNLCRLITASRLGNSELPWSTLVEHSESLIALSGCERGELASALRRAQGARVDKQPVPHVPSMPPEQPVPHVPSMPPEQLVPHVPSVPPEQPVPHGDPREVAGRYVEVFGRERFFVELQNHLLPKDHQEPWRELAGLAEELGLRTVATNDVHYVEKAHHRAQDVLVCIQTISRVYDSSSLRKLNAEYYLKSEEEMQRLFRDHPEALRNTREVAEMCNLDLELDTYRFPHFELPAGETAYSYLCKLCFRGAQERYKPLTPKVMGRLQHELQTINDLGFAEYFLVAWDIVRFAREQGIRCSGRGSAGDSLVCHVLGITDADPMAHANLIFERFMSREHSKMPDIDVDYCSRRRDEVTEYVYRKYGEGHVAAVCTLNTFQARSAIREVGKALALDPEDIDRMAKAFPYISAAEIPDAFETVPEVRDANIDVSNKRDLIEICQLISGFPRHLSVHVGGLVITREPLTDIVPLEWAAKGVVVAQYDKDDIEALGLVKMDVLGLRIHTAIADCLEYIEKGHGIKLETEKIPLDDEATFELIRSTNTIAMFQLESPGQRNLLGRSQPETFEELITQISLFRPGPVQSDMISPYLRRRHGEEPVTYPHPALEPILEVTHGVIIYQEQILQIGHALAGFTPGEADRLRRAMTTNRSSTEMRALRESFIKGALNNGVRLDAAEEVWEQVAAFASFGFCKAHACCFAKIAYQTAYLKAHYPAEFLAGILSAQPMGFYPAHVILEEAKRCGVGVLPPDINRSMARYTVD